ncbi:MAG: radical SAM protein [Calditrichaeota bacterium]|nr:MAG: radical SAM protein [Calditrichota bacterium]
MDLVSKISRSSKIAKELIRQKIKPFHKELPLPIPLTMHLDPTNLCNFKCTFCPTGDSELLKSVGRPKGQMEFELFCKIIDELAEMVNSANHKLKVLHLYKDGEPLIHKQFCQMVSYAKSKNAAETVGTTTNAALLTKEKSIQIIESGLDKIRISVEHVDDQSYKKITQNYSDYNTIKSNVKFLFNEKTKRKSSLHIFAKIVDTNLTEAEKQKFKNDFAPISDTLRIDSLMGWSNSETKDFLLGVDVSEGMNGTPLIPRKVCSEPFSKLAINFDGKVSVCCVDWSYGTIIGDLTKETLSEIWNGEKLREFRITHLKGEREKIEACKNCQYILGLPKESILDNHVEKLLKTYGV